MNRHANRSHHSISCFSQASQGVFGRSTELLVMEEEDAQHIDKRLDEAEQRLRLLSCNTQSSVRELKKLFGTSEKRRAHIRNKSASGEGHLHAIKHHLNLLQQDIYFQPHASQCKPGNHDSERFHEQGSSVVHLQSQTTTKGGWPSKHKQFDEGGEATELRQLQEEVAQLRKANLLSRQTIDRIENNRKEMQLQHQQQLRELRINLEHERLAVEEELLGQIDALSKKLARATSNQQSLELQTTNERLIAENTALKETARIERSLKIEGINHAKELEQELRLARQNNERLAQQVNDLLEQTGEMHPQLQRIDKDASWMAEMLLYSSEILQRTSNYQLPATVVMVKEELNLKKTSVRRVLTDVRSRRQANGSDADESTERSGLFRLRQECHYLPPNKLRKFISGDDSNKQNHYVNSTVDRRYEESQQQRPTAPFLEDLTEIFPQDQSELYMMLLTQAMALEGVVMEAAPNDYAY